MCVMFMSRSINLGISSIVNTTSLFIILTIYLLYSIGRVKANNLYSVKADVERKIDTGQPSFNCLIKRFWQGYAKKLDTYRSPWVGLFPLSWISRETISNLQATGGRSDFGSCLIAEGHSNEESSNTCAQEPKSENPVLNTERNNTIKELSDLSASTPKGKRRRSPHSSRDQKNPKPRKMKGDSERSQTTKQGSRNKISSPNLRMFVLHRLEQYKNKDGKYSGIIRILADAGFLQYCYMLIKGIPGNMSPGTTEETLDGLSYQWFVNVANDLKIGRFRFTPVRRVLIPKPGKREKRPLGVGSPREKIVQKGLQIILEAIYENMFLDCSHGFRPNRSTHSALKPLYLKGHQFKWVIQGDISKCFDTIPHDVIINLIKRQISCDRIIDLLHKAITVGYLNPRSKKLTKSTIGTPQGSVLSPLLANVVLHELDKYIMTILIPEYHKGKRRSTNPEYNRLSHIRHTKKDATTIEKENALIEMLKIPRMDINDPNYRRSMYIRYADDFVYLFEGPISEAKVIKEKIKEALLELTGLELNDAKTLITHSNKGFSFLGAHVKTLKRVGFMMKTKTVKGKPITMRSNVRARLNMPTKTLIEKLIKNKFARRNHIGKILAAPQTNLVNLDHSTIIQFYNSKIQGILNYYTFAANRIEIQNLIWIFRQSLAKTLARKLKLKSMRQAFKKYGPLLKDPFTDLKLLVPKSLPTIHKYNVKENMGLPSDIIEQTWYGRLTSTNLFKQCAICNTSANIQMHHLRSVKDVRAGMANHRSSFKEWIGASLRKQIPLCQYHHSLYHQGKLLNHELNLISKYSHNMTKDMDLKDIVLERAKKIKTK